MASKITINLDTSKENYLLEKCKQNDDLTLEAFIFENGAKKTLANTAITINILKPDGTFVAGSVNVGTQVTDNKITYPITRQATVVPGKAKIDITIVENTNKNNSTFEFDLIIKPLVTANAIASTNSVPIIQELQDKINEGGAIRDEIVQQIQAGGVQQWIATAAAPATNTGNVGDWHINSATGTVSQKTGAAAWGAKAELATDEDIRKIQNYTGYPQGTKPPRNGNLKSSFKIIHKTAENQLTIVQPTNQGCVKYIFERNSGASGTGDYGQHHELLRMVGAYHTNEAYLYYDIGTPVEGSYDPAGAIQTAAGKRNTTEELFLNNTATYSSTDTFSSKADGAGFAVYKLAASGTVSFNLTTTPNNKCNLMFLATPASSQNVTISVNGVVAKTFNPRAYIVQVGTSNNNAVGIVEFEVPIRARANTMSQFKVTITNAGQQVFYPCALNMKKLQEYNGEAINQYKCFGTVNGWITTTGASDYAIHDVTTNKWFGSYHGGEALEQEQILWADNLFEIDSQNNSNKTLSGITLNDWRVQRSFKIYQRTALAGTDLTTAQTAINTAQGKMISLFAFNTDGTLDMDFSYYNGTVNVNTFYTALTCTDKNFQYVFYPRYVNLGAVPAQTAATTYTQLPLSSGFISQVDPASTLQLDIRFTKFNNSADTRGPVIANSYAYRKLYYGPVYGTNKIVDHITFSKSLDFIVR